MRRWNLSHYAISSCVAAALLAGCGGSQPPIGVPGAMPQASALASRTAGTNYKVVYSFGAIPDGNFPRGSLIDVDGTLYGTTDEGGLYSYGCSDYGNCGTVFAITPSGTEKVLHSFGDTTDGASPVASLIEVKGTLYGTTLQGGENRCSRYYAGCGTVFSITPSGTEKVLHNFGAGIDGFQPFAPLIDVKGTLYGTTYLDGGNYCGYYPGESCGTVFTITTGGTESVVYRFTSGGGGFGPKAGLLNVGGKMYGTTYGFGAYHHDRSSTVFSITRGGKEKTLHTFGKGTDGVHPHASLIEVAGTLYGTTYSGGAYNRGTVFSITPSGSEKVLHSFGYGTDGAFPIASLIALKGTLYGTTEEGGDHSGGCAGTGCGTVFSLTTGGTETVLHNFGGKRKDDGAEPLSGLLNVDSTLYGTTGIGGKHNDGTIFALTL
ncbi:MAG: choice-of-anchor tandem repeat GloVer-containing protein [Candidatus Cybelea sp.]